MEETKGKTYDKNCFSRHNSKRRKRGNTSTFSSPKKRALLEYNRSCSWYESNYVTDSKNIEIEHLLRADRISITVDNSLNENQEQEKHGETSKERLSASDFKINRAKGDTSTFFPEESDIETESEDVSEEESMENESYSMWIFDINILENAIDSCMVCSKCHSNMCMIEVCSHRAGLGTKFMFECENSDCKNYFSFNSTKKTGKIYEINKKSVLAFRSIGKGRSAAEKVTSILGLSTPVNIHSFSDQTNVLETKTFDLMNSCMKKAGELARNLELKNTGLEPGDDPIDVPTCFDGTWCSRGYSSTKGVITAIAENTSQVIDVALKINTCRECNKANEKRKTGIFDEIQYLDWFISHEEKCLCNHGGSAQSMEKDAVLEIYNRSVKLHRLRYRPFIGDGDSSSFSNVEKAMPYGPLINMFKSECVNHVTKRMGSGLRKLLQSYKGKKLKDGKALGGKGRLTLAKVDAMQNFYGRSLRDNKGNPKAMVKSVNAILKHYSSTANRHFHDGCPIGEKSWCSYQRDRATNKSSYKPTKYPFTDAMVEVMTPLFKRLADPAFLESCKMCHTQNPNESFNHLLWSLAPKAQYVSPQETSFARNLAVCIYNDGWLSTFKDIFNQMGFELSIATMKRWKNIDNKRIREGNFQMRESTKIKRRLRKRMFIKKQDAFQHAEGINYSSGAFYA